jgi:hypothetical protein
MIVAPVVVTSFPSIVNSPSAGANRPEDALALSRPLMSHRKIGDYCADVLVRLVWTRVWLGLSLRCRNGKKQRRDFAGENGVEGIGDGSTKERK